MPTLSTVLLSTKGECRKINLPLSSDGALTMDAIQKYVKKKEQPEMVGHYEYDSKVFFLFGYKKGKKGTENKVELPAPYSETPLYGDIIIVASLGRAWENPIPCTIEQWNAFYQQEEDEKEESEEELSEDEKEEDDKSVKDAFEDSDTEKESIPDKEEVEEEEEVPVVVKRRRAPVYTKVDTAALKEEISVESPPESNTMRLACIKNLSFLESFTADDIRSLEKSIFESSYQFAQRQYIARNWKSSGFCEVYRQMVRSVISNIHPQSPVQNTRLLKRVEEGEFKLDAIPFMSAYEMYPEKWFALKDKLLQREQKILEGNKSRATDQFKCRRCQKKECTYYELQTRSADEPMTIFITCLNCGKEWRQGG